MDIKPIETVYNGYKFRSRLEARWAVFFDALGVKWEYEQEGYVLDDGVRYLPDFWLPQQETYIEIKPQIGEPEKDVAFYLAGKIGHKDWRDTIVSFTSARCHTTTNGYRYIGPFWAGDWHSPDALDHGSELASEHDNHCSHADDLRDNLRRRQGVVNTSFEQIKAADIVFAWIHEADCYGTLVELGYAAALGKTIWVAFESCLTVAQDMWFAATIAQADGNKFRICDSAQEAFTEWLRPLPADEDKCRRLSLCGKQTMLVRGDPYHNSYNAAVFESGRRTLSHSRLVPTVDRDPITLFPFRVPPDMTLKSEYQKPLDAAYYAARQARFEHGSRGR